MALTNCIAMNAGATAGGVMINVLARRAREHVATINHGFEKPATDDPVPVQTFLDPLNRQSQWAEALLELFVNAVLADEDYRRRLVWHYRMFKNVVEDAAHPAHRLLHLPEGAAPVRGGSIPPPPLRRGQRKRWC